ncbi:MAG TPA: Ig-like domain-containing protein [Verrucomicrobiae bacterium]
MIAVGFAAVTAKAAPPATPQGMITAKVYMGDGTGNTSVATLTNYINTPNSPILTYHPSYFESWATGDITTPPMTEAGDGYGDDLMGYFYAPTNGNYTFWIASQDNSALYLSPDSTAANKVLIAQVSSSTGVRGYTSETGNTANTPEMDSATFTGTQWATKDTNVGGAVITLTAGKAYYIEALHQAAAGGDHCSVSIDGVAPIPGSMLSSVDVAGGAPTVVSVTGSALFKSVTVVFSEPLDPVSATTAANYSLNNGVTISSATLHSTSGEGDSNTVVLVTSLQPTNTAFTLTINNVKDVSSNTIAAATKANFQSYVWVPGWMTYEQWTADTMAQDVATFETDISNNVENLSTFTVAEPKFDGPWLANEPGIQWNTLNSISYAWFTAPTNDDYVFFLASDDASDLFLSTDSTPENKRLIAQEAGWSNEYNWETIGGGSVASDKRSDTFAVSAWPNPNVITLTNGQVYYIEIDHHQGGGGAGAGATYMLADDPNITAGPAQSASGETLTGNVIGTYVDIAGASVAISKQPSSVSVVQGFFASFQVVGTGVSPYSSTLLYQWQKAAPGSGTFADLPGANGTTLTTGVLGLADTGTQFRVIVSVPGASQTSSAATVTVTADTTPPTLVSAGAISNALAGTEIGVVFNKPMGAGITTLANYSVDNGATITAANYWSKAAGTLAVDANGNREPDYDSGIVLSVSTLDPSKSYHVTVSNVKDAFGNLIAANSSIPVSISPFTWESMGETVTNSANPTGATNAAFATGTNSFNLINGGNAFWATEDDITMVYETVKGDFDRTVQVEWNEPSSHWARAGLSARASVAIADDFGPTVPQYQTVLSDPETNVVYGSVDDSPANDQYETNRRLATGDQTDGNNSEGNPHYPGSWVRLKRVGQTISMFYSSSTNDVKWWYPIGTTDFDGATNIVADVADPLPETLFVGPTYGCENGNIAGQGGTDAQTGYFVARFKNYLPFPQKPRGTATAAIGFHFGESSPSGTGAGNVAAESPGAYLSTNDVAGVNAVAQDNWNNLFDITATNHVGYVVEENETTGGTTILTNVFVGASGSGNLWQSQGPGSDNTTPAGNGASMTGEDAILMTSYLDSGNASATDVGITNIPANMVAEGYDVIVYTLGGVAGRGGAFAVLDTSTNVLEGYYAVQSPATPTGFVQAIPDASYAASATPTSWATGNFVVFTNLKASAIIVEGSTLGTLGFSGTPRAPINAIQLVSPSGIIGGSPIIINHPTIAVTSAGVITYNGVLRSSSSVQGPFTIVSGATSPYTIPSAGGTRFFVATQN